MKKQRFFVISKPGRFDPEPIIWFESLEHAMEMFKVLTEGQTVELGTKNIKKVKKKKGEYRDTDEFRFIKGKETYHLESKFIDIYTEEELEDIEKKRLKILKNKAQAKKARRKKKVK